MALVNIMTFLNIFIIKWQILMITYGIICLVAHHYTIALIRRRYLFYYKYFTFKHFEMFPRYIL